MNIPKAEITNITIDSTFNTSEALPINCINRSNSNTGKAACNEEPSLILLTVIIAVYLLLNFNNIAVTCLSSCSAQ